MAFQSKSQSRACYAKKDKKQNGSWDCEEWSDHTDYKKLPEKVGLDLSLLKAARIKLAAKGELGPYQADRAADVVGADASLAAIEKNRKEHPGHYWLNPFVRGPLTEMFTRLGRRMNASAGTNVPNALLRETFNSTGALTALGGPAGAPIGAGIGIGAGALHTGIGGYMGGSQRKEQMRTGHEGTERRYGERDEDKAELKKDKRNEKRSNITSFGCILGKVAAAPPPQRQMGMGGMGPVPTPPQAPPRQMGINGRGPVPAPPQLGVGGMGPQRQATPQPNMPNMPFMSGPTAPKPAMGGGMGQPQAPSMPKPQMGGVGPSPFPRGTTR